MRQPHPSLVEWLATTPPPRGRVAVPGCGRGHDARALARAGYAVVGFDFAAAAIEEARALARRDGVDVTYERRDLFALGRDYAGQFDGVWEYTCFCAIAPRRRREYVEVLERILRPGGWLLAVFWPVRPGGGGPPFPMSRAGVRRLLAPGFRIEREGPPPRPVLRRQPHEWLVFAYRTSGPA
jgi:methyl halide transferase